jgi:ascorbate-specific PTS system EIIC-type component UlaA
MKPWMRRVIFYGGTLVIVVVMCQNFFKEAFLTVFGDETGESLFSFVRTNVEAPISVIFIALYLDLIMAKKPPPGAANNPPVFGMPAGSERPVEVGTADNR